MKNHLFRLGSGWLLALWLLPGSVAGQVITFKGYGGDWNGQLNVPGAHLPVKITITQHTPIHLSGELLLPQRRATSFPMTVKWIGDSLVCFSAIAECRFASQPTPDNKELHGLWSQQGLRIPLTLRRSDAPPVSSATPTVAAPTGPPVPCTEEVTFKSKLDNVLLAGTLTLPNAVGGPYPAVVLLSDMGMQDRNGGQGNYLPFKNIADHLARAGIAVLRYDDRSMGQSGGSSSAATTADLVRDAQSGLNYLRALPTIDPMRLGMVGHGEGGNVALLAAAQPLAPAFVVTLASSGLVGKDLLAAQPGTAYIIDSIQVKDARQLALAVAEEQAAKNRAGGATTAQVESFLNQQRQKQQTSEKKLADSGFKFQRDVLEIIDKTSNNDQAQAIVANMLRQREANLEPNAARARAVQLTTPWYRYYLKFDPKKDLAGVKCPVLLVHGTDDALVNAETNLTALEKGLKHNPSVAIRRLPGIAHQLQTPSANMPLTEGRTAPTVAPSVLTTIGDWVRQQVGL